MTTAAAAMAGTGRARPGVEQGVQAALGRPTGRGRPRGPWLHAVPGRDRTRSALCGARVGGAVRPWPARTAGPVAEPRACPDCTALLRSSA